jgi:hypothetical protein
MASAADEAVSQWKKPIDVEQTNDLSVLVGSRNHYIAKVPFRFSLFSASWDCLYCSKTSLN